MPSAKNRFAAVLLAGLMAMMQVPSSGLAQQDDQQPGAETVTATPTSTGGDNILTMPAKRLFGMQKLPAHLKSAAIGTYAMGCLAGAQQLPITGDSWQVMRLSRNRNWGTPQLIALLEKLSAEAKAQAGWNGFLVGDMAQPRGGPMITGHASHQIGLGCRCLVHTHA